MQSKSGEEGKKAELLWVPRKARPRASLRPSGPQLRRYVAGLMIAWSICSSPLVRSAVQFRLYDATQKKNGPPLPLRLGLQLQNNEPFLEGENATRRRQGRPARPDCFSYKAVTSFTDLAVSQPLRRCFRGKHQDELVRAKSQTQAEERLEKRPPQQFKSANTRAVFFGGGAA